MPKLHLKRTPQEESDRRARKKRRRESKSSKHAPRSPSDSEPEPSSSHRSHDYEALLAELEDARFREKMASAFADDDSNRLDTLEAQMNDYAHVPDRWRAHAHSGSSRSYYDLPDEDLTALDPRHMDDEEYAEWVRAGMYRKTHAREHAEEQERKALREARRAEEKARKAETRRLERIAEEERLRRRRIKKVRRAEEAKLEYAVRWKELLAPSTREGGTLGFIDIPWPVLAAYRTRDASLSSEDLSADAIAAFLVPSPPSQTEDPDWTKRRKDKLRETFLRFHPDKFEGRLMPRVREADRPRVREAIGAVVRALNDLMDGDAL